MKKHDKQNKKDVKKIQDERQTVDDFYNTETGQPVPQAKDYEEIDY